MTCEKLYPNDEANNEVYLVTFPRCRPRDGSEQRKWPLVQVKKHHQQKWLLAPHQWKLLLMHILPKSQDPEADGGLNDSSALVDPSNTRRKAPKRSRQNSRAIVTLQNWRGTKSPPVSRRHLLRISTLLRRRETSVKLSGWSSFRQLLRPVRLTRRIRQMPC